MWKPLDMGSRVVSSWVGEDGKTFSVASGLFQHRDRVAEDRCDGAASGWAFLGEGDGDGWRTLDVQEEGWGGRVNYSTRGGRACAAPAPGADEEEACEAKRLTV